MAKYTVNVSVNVWAGGHVEVTARSEKAAVKKAIKELLTSRQYYLTDLDGNRMDFEEEQIEVLCVDKG